jgi:DNA-binding MarR family transcriptional regulator
MTRIAEADQQAQADVAQRLRRVVGHLTRLMRPVDASLAVDLTPTRTAVLLNTVRNGRARLADVAEQEGLNPTLLSRTLATLAEDGLVERVSDPDDRRVAWVSPTPAGRRLAQRIRAQRTAALHDALASLSDAERHRIEAALPALERLVEHFNQDLT